MAGRKHYEDHHGGGLWLKDQDGWFIVRNMAGMEWSAQFCADPQKVDQLRENARRLYDKFPEAVEELGIRELLDEPITTAKGIAAWTDSICNASVPLSEGEHRGVLPKSGGIHHYPSPVAEIEFFKYDDFQLWVTEEQGRPQRSRLSVGAARETDERGCWPPSLGPNCTTRSIGRTGRGDQ